MFSPNSKRKRDRDRDRDGDGDGNRDKGIKGGGAEYEALYKKLSAMQDYKEKEKQLRLMKETMTRKMRMTWITILIMWTKAPLMMRMLATSLIMTPCSSCVITT